MSEGEVKTFRALFSRPAAFDPYIYDNIHEKLFWRFFKDCDKNIDLILEIHIFLIHQLVCFWEKFVKMPISGPVEA